jgi:hypothetical protein
MNGRRRCRFGIFQLGGWHTPCELRHDRASNLLGINNHVVLEAVAMRARNASRPIGSCARGCQPS